MKKENSKEKIILKGEKREILGKKVKKLRKEGWLPANIYGREIKSQSIKVKIKDFIKAYKKAGTTQIIYLSLKGEKKELPVLIQNVQKHPTTDSFLHADFRHVNLASTIKTLIPLKLKGESEAVKSGEGVLLSLTEELMVEALPQNLPEKIEIDISSLKKINDEIRVKDLKIVGDYKIVEPPNKVIVRIIAHKEETTESQVVSPETVEVTKEKKEETNSPNTS